MITCPDAMMHVSCSGSAAANTLSQIYICAFLFAYIWWKKLHVKTWGGEEFNVDCLAVFTYCVGFSSFSVLFFQH